MNGRESDAGISGNYILRAIAVMRIEIPDSDPFCSINNRIEGGDRDTAEIAKPHCLPARGVVAGWTIQRERAFAFAGRSRRFDRSSGGLARVMINFWISRRVDIKVARWFGDVLQMFSRMRAEQFFIGCRAGFAPFPF